MERFSSNSICASFMCFLLIWSSTATSSNSDTVSQLTSYWNDHQRPLNVLVLTIQASGHTGIPLALGEELAKRGHNVTLCMSGDKYQKAAESVGLTYISNGPAIDFAQYGAVMTNGGMANMLEMFRGLRKGIEMNVDNYVKILQENQLGTDWDMVLATDFLSYLLPCLSEFLHCPVVMIHSATQHYHHTYPPWPWASVTMGAQTDDMTFGQRLLDVLDRTIAPSLQFSVFKPAIEDKMETFCPGQASSVRVLFTASSIRIPDIVPTVIGVEFPRTISPLSHYVGPILPANSEPCTGELETWLNSKQGNSVIYISMGSITNVMKETAQAFIEGIKKTNYSIMWALRKSGDFELDISPERIYIDKWLPQLSVLRHKAVGLSIMHGGANGLHESLHSGVPLILVPGMFEQAGNAGRVHHHRLGIKLNKDTLTAEQIYESIVEIDSGDYRENVAKLQKVFRQAGGVKRAADLIEFYSEVGYDHLIPAYAKYQWTWVQYYNADVYCTLLAALLLTVYLWYRVIKCICSRCCKSKKPKSD